MKGFRFQATGIRLSSCKTGRCSWSPLAGLCGWSCEIEIWTGAGSRRERYYLKPETYKPKSGLFFFQASQATERSQRTIIAE